MTIEEMYGNAIQMAADVFSVKLDFQAADVDILENRILPALALMHQQGKLSPAAASNVSAFFGAYLGELMLREFAAAEGYAWKIEQNEDGNLPILVKEKAEISPMTKVYKRLTLGKEDDLRSFYRFTQMFVANGSEVK